MVWGWNFGGQLLKGWAVLRMKRRKFQWWRQKHSILVSTFVSIHPVPPPCFHLPGWINPIGLRRLSWIFVFWILWSPDSIACSVERESMGLVNEQKYHVRTEVLGVLFVTFLLAFHLRQWLYVATNHNYTHAPHKWVHLRVSVTQESFWPAAWKFSGL